MADSWQAQYTQHVHNFHEQAAKMRNKRALDDLEFRKMDDILYGSGYSVEFIHHYRTSGSCRDRSEPLVINPKQAWRLRRIGFREYYRDRYKGSYSGHFARRAIKNIHLIRPELAEKMANKWRCSTFDDQIYFRPDDVDCWYFINIKRGDTKDMSDSEVWLMIAKHLITNKPKEKFSWG